MIKVVHISTSNKGGAGIAAFRLHKALNKTNEIDSYFIQKDESKNNLSDKVFHVSHFKPDICFRVMKKFGLIDYVENQPVRLDVFKNYLNFEIATFPETSYKIEEHPLIKKADIIHLHWVAGFLNYPSFFKKIKKPIVWTLHDMNPFQGLFHYKNDELQNESSLGNINRKVLQSKERFINKNNNIKIITLCKWMNDISEESKALRKYKHQIIPNLIDFDHYPLLNRQLEKKKLNVDNGLKTLMFIAENIKNKRKGLDLLLEALNGVQESVNIITVGGEKVILNSNFNHLHFDIIDNMTQLNSIYSAADLVLITSREDNLPNVMLEAFANGTPVLSFKTGGMKDWIIENETGILVEPFSTFDLTNKIKLFLSNNYNFSNEKIHLYAKNNFSIENKLSDYINLYKLKINK